jgi:flagellar motor switch protein FliG
MEKTQEKKGIFINGKGQIIEMLQRVSSKEKARILRNLHLKNPYLAEELSKKSLSFQEIKNLHDDVIKKALNQIDPAILGVAIKNSDESLQRKFLKLSPTRAYTEKAYYYLSNPLSNETRIIERARNKVLEQFIHII